MSLTTLPGREDVATTQRGSMKVVTSLLATLFDLPEGWSVTGIMQDGFDAHHGTATVFVEGPDLPEKEFGEASSMVEVHYMQSDIDSRPYATEIVADGEVVWERDEGDE